jgi:arylsulfatase A-like enzyme
MPGLRDVDSTRQVVTLPQYFAQNGYYTASFGKVHHDGSIPRGLQANEFENWGPSPFPVLPEKKFMATPSDNPWVDWGVFPPDDSRQPDWTVTSLAITLLAERPRDRPFFLAVGYRLPHVPCYVSQSWFDRVPSEEEIQLPVVPAGDLDDVPLFSRYLHWKVPEPDLAWLKDAGEWRSLVRAYLACTTFMDAQLGRLLGALHDHGLEQDTVVVVWSDNGWHLGEKQITGKNTLWERSTRVPLIFAGPGVTEGQRCSQPVELLDIYPTLVELCDLPAKAGLEGSSLKRQLRDGDTPRRRPAITDHNQGNHAVRSSGWRYIRYADDSEELYDMACDPHEWTNLVHESDFAVIRREHRKWLPESSAAPAPGSAHRILTQTNGIWYWEGKPITPPER